ncbi:MAG: hypothetical protein PW788_03290 [Micavibrio sp.]|nr:hypothetical protein [Micavibrio sp.]
MTAYVEYQTFRTTPFHVTKADDEKVISYWCYETAVGLKTGRLTQVDVGGSYRMTSPFTDQMPEEEALLKLAEIEAEARIKFTPADDQNFELLRRMGSEYANTTYFREHPVMVSNTRHHLLKKQSVAGKYKLKP